MGLGSNPAAPISSDFALVSVALKSLMGSILGVTWGRISVLAVWLTPCVVRQRSNHEAALACVSVVRWSILAVLLPSLTFFVAVVL